MILEFLRCLLTIPVHKTAKPLPVLLGKVGVAYKLSFTLTDGAIYDEKCKNQCQSSFMKQFYQRKPHENGVHSAVTIGANPTQILITPLPRSILHMP